MCVCEQMWNCWRTRPLWKVSRSRWTRPCWSTPCLPILSSRTSSASWWCGCRSCAPSARRQRTTCATCTWVERCPATTCSSRCCTPSERACEVTCTRTLCRQRVLFVYNRWDCSCEGESDWDTRYTRSNQVVFVRASVWVEEEEVLSWVWNYEAPSVLKVIFHIVYMTLMKWIFIPVLKKF